MDQCIYQMVSGSKICFLVLYMDDIVLVTNDKGLLYEVKKIVKPRKNAIFLKNGKTVICHCSTG